MVDSTTSHDIVVDVPIRVAYNQWTQFEEFPLFMKAVESVEQLDDARVHFKVKIAGHVVEYDATILQQIPDARIAWVSTTGKDTGGTVTFEALGPTSTRVTLTLRYAPEGVLEKLGDLMGVVARQTQQDLAHFKAQIESRGVESGGWRGEIGPTR